MSIKDYIISKIIRLKIVKDLCEKSKILDLIEKDSNSLVANTTEYLFVDFDYVTKLKFLNIEEKIIKNLTSHIYRAERINFVITEDLLFKTIINYNSEKQVFRFLCKILKNRYKDKFSSNENYDYIRKEVFKRIRKLCKLVLSKGKV